MRIVVVGVVASSVLSFRGEMLRAMASRGHDVTAVAPEQDDRVRDGLAEIGVGYQSVPFRRTGMNPIRDISLVRRLRRVFRDPQADAVLVYAAKPVVYGLVSA